MEDLSKEDTSVDIIVFTLSVISSEVEIRTEEASESCSD